MLQSLLARSRGALVAAALGGLMGLGGLGAAPLALAQPADPASAQASAAATPAAAATAATSASAAAVPITAPAAARPQFRITPVPEGWHERLPRNAEAATQAYLDRLPADVVARADRYFEGGYWLQLWDFLLGLAIAALMLGRRRSARVRDWAQRVGRRAFARDALYGMVYGGAGWLLALPLAIYRDFWREHAYGMATQGFGAWMAEQLIVAVITLIVFAIAVPIFYAVLRRAGERWWLWGTVTTAAGLVVMLLVTPIWVAPLFNTYKPVEDGEIKAAVLAMAHANGVPVDKVYEFDASRQTTRVSANVSGIFGSASVRLNDNLLRRTRLPEIRAVMGHELGHFVMNHVPKLLMQLSLLVLAGFLFSQWAMGRLLARRGAAWGLNGVADTASLPLLSACFAVFMFVATPLFNTMVRTGEVEADRFGLNLAREPHGFAEAILKLAEYRKPDPGALEEFVFFDHPSARARILDAMRWREAMGTP